MLGVGRQLLNWRNGHRPVKKRQTVMPRRVVALLADQACLFELGIAAELFGLARPELGSDWYRFDVLATAPGGSGACGALRLRARTGLRMLAHADIVVIPGWPLKPEPTDPRLLQALRRTHGRGARLFSICSGAFVLAEAGLLDGLPATTHWRYCEAFAQRFPRVRWQPDVLYVDTGRILTSAGSAAGIDAGLHLIAQDHGHAVANRVAQRLLVSPHRDGGQRQFIPSAYPRQSGSRFAQVLAWAQAHLDRPVTVAMLAEQAAMSERNFQRRFVEATGQSPKAWLQRLRIAKARELCEAGITDFDAIAAACGFASPETFRAAFRRSVGLSPSAYRRRFAMRAANAPGHDEAAAPSHAGPHRLPATRGASPRRTLRTPPARS